MKNILKKLLYCFMTLALLMSGTNTLVFAEDLENNTVLLIEDDEITENMIEVGESYAQEKSISRARTDGELWTLQSYKTVVSHGPIKAAFGAFVPSGETKTETCSWSVSAGTAVSGYPLSVSVSGSKSIKKSGPSSSDTLTNGKSATHRSFFSVGYGRLVKYTYKVTSKYSGNYLRTETKYMYSDVSTLSCSQLVHINSSTIYAQNSDKTKVRKTTLTNYKAKLKKTDGTCLYYYEW